ncbi:MAG: thioredoxin domain-containing protein, partial [Gammaproteobacteria bacterium]|nr:thioredoxin domain-containing protein [Gammaproteobacteria bacterium]
MDQQSLIFDVDESGFESEVIEASRQTPVAADFWAAWCAPCRALTPVLEKVVASLAGKIRLAKVDTEQNQQLAGALGIRSLPTVKLFKDARVVDEFVGAYPESQLKTFFARHLDSASDARLGQAEALLRNGRSDEARALLEAALSDDPENAGVRLKLAALKLAAGAFAEAEATLGALTQEQRQSDTAKRLFALL